jgi:hypothetical protein
VNSIFIPLLSRHASEEEGESDHSYSTYSRPQADDQLLYSVCFVVPAAPEETTVDRLLTGALDAFGGILFIPGCYPRMRTNQGVRRQQQAGLFILG